jgi:hypothetical protein
MSSWHQDSFMCEISGGFTRLDLTDDATKITGPRTRFRSGQGREPYGRDKGRKVH